MRKGYQYIYDYPDINVRISNKINIYKIEVTAIIPKDIQDWEIGDAFLVRIKMYKNDFKEIFIKFPFIIYNDRIENYGKNRKWILKNEVKTNICLNDIPNSIDCSLNTYEHPKNRNWMVHEFYTLSNSNEYKTTSWVDYKNFGYSYEYNFYLLYYRLICEILSFELGDKIRNFTFESLKEIMNDSLEFDNKYSYDKNIINEYHINYLRDFLYYWKDE